MKQFIINFLMWTILIGIFFVPYIVYIDISSIGAWK